MELEQLESKKLDMIKQMIGKGSADNSKLAMMIKCSERCIELIRNQWDRDHEWTDANIKKLRDNMKKDLSDKDIASIFGMPLEKI